MKIYAFIPLRSGSKGIIKKNIKHMAGKPLAQWVIDSANKSYYVDETYISTDSDEISDPLSECYVHKRSDISATDEASSEIVLLEFCENLEDDDIVVFIQATSPLLEPSEIDEGIESIIKGGYDSAISVVRQKRFIWENGNPINYNLNNRPRRQEWDGYLVENGAFYISKVKNIKDSKLRVSSKISTIICSEYSYFEIDDISDWYILESIIENKNIKK